MLMETQGIVEFFNQRLDLQIELPRPRKFMQKWRDLAERFEIFTNENNLSEKQNT
jgi:CTP synthase